MQQVCAICGQNLDKPNSNKIWHKVNIDHQIVSFLIYIKPLMILAVFISCYTKPNLLLSQPLSLAIAQRIL